MYTLRPATEDDYDFLYALHRAAIRAYVEPIWGWHEEWQAEYFRRKFSLDGRRIIRIDGEDAGVLVLEERPAELYVALIELLPRYQGRGVGTAVLIDLQAQARSRRVALTLHVLRTNEAARRLYERLGFRVVDAGGAQISHGMVARWHSGGVGMNNRSFAFFGGLAAILALALFLVLSRSLDWSWYWLWIIAASGVAFLFYGYDKVSAKAGGGRVPELVLHLLALAGGFVGALLGMLVFRHKSNFRAHPLFIPIMIIGGAVWGVIIYYLNTQAS